MVAIITVEKGFSSRLAERAFGRSGPDYSEAWRVENWHGPTAQMVVLVDHDTATIRWLGRAVRGRRVSSRDLLVKVIEIREIESIGTAAVLRLWSDPNRRLRDARNGTLEDSDAVELLNALLTINSDLGPLMQLLDRSDGPLLGTGARGELRNQERDALGLILGLTGIERTELGRWAPPPDDDVPFLTGLTSYLERETRWLTTTCSASATGPTRQPASAGAPSPTGPAASLS
jgi:hypothetical protein